MTESEARALAAEINRHPGWSARAEEKSNLNRDDEGWWVQAHHDAMRATPTTPYPTLPIYNREDWEAARQKWG